MEAFLEPSFVPKSLNKFSELEMPGVLCGAMFCMQLAD